MRPRSDDEALQCSVLAFLLCALVLIASYRPGARDGWAAPGPLLGCSRHAQHAHGGRALAGAVIVGVVALLIFARAHGASAVPERFQQLANAHAPRFDDRYSGCKRQVS